MATKLHELLAVAGDVQAAAVKLNQEAIGTFGKPEFFTAIATETKHFDAKDQNEDDSKRTNMATTVSDKLSWLVGANTRYWNNILRRESANQHAVADIKVGDAVLAEKVPATVLLAMERHIAELRRVYEAIPTLSSGGLWEMDPAAGKNVWVNKQTDTRLRTRKSMRPVEMSPATPHHPAQVQAISEDIAIGRIETRTWSGMITTAQKATLLERIDQVARAVKTARQRANNVEAPDVKFAGALFDFIHAGVVG